MKKVVAFILCMTMLCAFAVPSYALDIPNGGSIPMKAKTNVNYRSGPGTNYDSWGILNTGERFQVNNDDDDPWYGGRAYYSTSIYNFYTSNGWNPIPYGYVHSDYLEGL